jgi:hypothetical protein
VQEGRKDLDEDGLVGAEECAGGAEGVVVVRLVKKEAAYLSPVIIWGKKEKKFCKGRIGSYHQLVWRWSPEL